ncbi:MAG TPA: DUF4416 family protein [Sedimentisphaerales bacterium]|jgi:hypothetical protein|nr:DUF4416 family protein [Sedimentisphaerales bacterium]HNU28458.1 DUF4416 family protein [Sedimentisphaerales bacterium]
MWELKEPRPVKLIVGILASDERCLAAARDAVFEGFGPPDLQSDVWIFDQTDYYVEELGPRVLRQFVSIERLIDPGDLADVKHRTNEMEKQLAATLAMPFPRPVNLDPGVIEPSKLILASTKNFAHRIYIGRKMYAEVTLVFDKGRWRLFPYTFPDYKRAEYHKFFSTVRSRLVQQLRQTQDPEPETRDTHK